MKKSKIRNMSYCALFTTLIIAGAFIQIPVPFMDYFTLQFLFVILSGMILGPKLGATSVGTYVMLGLLGVPVFAAGGGIQYVFRPSFGYLIGFIAASFLVGCVVKKIQAKSFKKYLISALTGFLTTYFIGILYKFIILNLYLKTPTSLSIIILSCFPLDIPGDIVLCIMGATLASKINPILRGRYIEYSK
ncbi:MULTISPECIES: biotin transporter BioY [unclassified Clostridium]|uniref:biotin transporter BioY n=1 Tax=unclassified Clostridium TaxID=2614128 RepID=UPI0013F0CF92|nr:MULTISPECIES: biotin transporter BioY [unclassified Clostridium]NFG61089.1 biotin transporter BioY [Clostridium botulinum]NFQ08835.1 biotin transporter BioY [Clostridium botulinum]